MGYSNPSMRCASAAWRTTRGDQRKRLYWDEAILHQAREHNRCLDPDGYVADADILPATARRAGEKVEKVPAAN
ncbi:hypothetical protein [Enterobacter hormaechei]|uniref:hypothetical protein n=1 Tax=Enterobacter hormaechei TaxID=158836 RepID=UPI0021CAFD20|nr:hypothetical protein [Enterobacter hormaechei]